jgi:hypothetical protein
VKSIIPRVPQPSQDISFKLGGLIFSKTLVPVLKGSATSDIFITEVSYGNEFQYCKIGMARMHACVILVDVGHGFILTAVADLIKATQITPIEASATNGYLRQVPI